MSVTNYKSYKHIHLVKEFKQTQRKKMAASNYCLLLLVLAGCSVAQPPTVYFAAGELLDIIDQLQQMGLDYWPAEANKTAPQFYIFNDNLKRFFQLSGGLVANHVDVLGSLKPKATGNLFELRRLDQGFITFAVDGQTGVCNGAASGAGLQTGQWLFDPSHHYALHRGDSANVVMLQNRGNGMCVSASGKNDSPLTIIACDQTDATQQWQLCQNQISNPAVDADKVCWPRDDTVTDRRTDSTWLRRL